MDLSYAIRPGHGHLRRPSVFPLNMTRVNSSLERNGGRATIKSIKRKMHVPSAAGVGGMTNVEDSTILKDNLEAVQLGREIGYEGIHHVGLLCKNLEVSLDFYHGLLGLTLNPDRPNRKLPYRGAWLWIGAEMIHLMELPNPDPSDGRPEHGGRDRHFCVAIKNLEPLAEALDKAKVTYTRSMSGRPAIFFRDPDMNCLECVETAPST